MKRLGHHGVYKQSLRLGETGLLERVDDAALLDVPEGAKTAVINAYGGSGNNFLRVIVSGTKRTDNRTWEVVECRINTVSGHTNGGRGALWAGIIEGQEWLLPYGSYDFYDSPSRAAAYTIADEMFGAFHIVFDRQLANTLRPHERGQAIVAIPALDETGTPISAQAFVSEFVLRPVMANEHNQALVQGGEFISLTNTNARGVVEQRGVGRRYIHLGVLSIRERTGPYTFGTKAISSYVDSVRNSANALDTSANGSYHFMPTQEDTFFEVANQASGTAVNSVAGFANVYIGNSPVGPTSFSSDTSLFVMRPNSSTSNKRAYAAPQLVLDVSRIKRVLVWNYKEVSAGAGLTDAHNAGLYQRRNVTVDGVTRATRPTTIHFSK